MNFTSTYLRYQLSQDARLWFYFIGHMTLFRLTFIVFFRSKLETANITGDLFWTFLNGFHYDAIVASIWILPSLLANMGGISAPKFTGNRLRLALGDIYNIVAAIAFVATIAFFREFDDQFNRSIFGLYYENTRAVLHTIWTDYNVALSCFIVIVIISLTYVSLRFILGAGTGTPAGAIQREPPISSGILLMFPVSLIFAFGNVHVYNPRNPSYETTNISDTFLQKTVLNPFLALYDATAAYLSAGDAEGLDAFLPSRDIKQAAHSFYGTNTSGNSLDDFLKREARGTRHKPRHIFLIIMESVDVWPLLNQYAELRLTENLKKYSEEGIFIKNFLPASDASIQSREAILTGVPYVLQRLDTVSDKGTALTTSLASAFNRLGYKSRLFYGGYVHATNLARLARSQGFSEIYGAEHITRTDSVTPWGVHDESLFDYIIQHLDDRHPSFNVVITTSYHPPYSIDLYRIGFSLKSIPPSLQPLYDGTTDIRTLGHLWYSDQCIGAFVRNAEKMVRSPLFAFTGDHSSRRFLNAKPSFFESSTVPFILYGKSVLQDTRIPDTMAGSHIDIAPTLIELAAPKGFTYYAIGADLLSSANDHVGIGFFKVIGPDFIIELFSNSRVHPLPGRSLPDRLPEISWLRSRMNQLYAIGWWRIHRGTDLSSDTIANTNISNTAIN